MNEVGDPVHLSSSMSSSACSVIPIPKYLGESLSTWTPLQLCEQYAKEELLRQMSHMSHLRDPNGPAISSYTLMDADDIGYKSVFHLSGHDLLEGTIEWLQILYCNCDCDSADSDDEDGETSHVMPETRKQEIRDVWNLFSEHQLTPCRDIIYEMLRTVREYLWTKYSIHLHYATLKDWIRNPEWWPAKNSLNHSRPYFKTGDLLDVLDATTSIWWIGQVIGETQDQIQVHYLRREWSALVYEGIGNGQIRDHLQDPWIDRTSSLLQTSGMRTSYLWYLYGVSQFEMTLYYRDQSEYYHKRYGHHAYQHPVVYKFIRPLLYSMEEGMIWQFRQEGQLGVRPHAKLCHVDCNCRYFVRAYTHGGVPEELVLRRVIVPSLFRAADVAWHGMAYDESKDQLVCVQPTFEQCQGVLQEAMLGELVHMPCVLLRMIIEYWLLPCRWVV